MSWAASRFIAVARMAAGAAALQQQSHQHMSRRETPRIRRFW